MFCGIFSHTLIYFPFVHCLIWFIFHDYYYSKVLKSSLYLLSSRPLVSIRVVANSRTRVFSCSIWWFMIFNHLLNNSDLSLPWTYECFSSFIFIFDNLLLFDARSMPYVYKAFFLASWFFFLVWLNMTEGHTSTVCSIITFCWSNYYGVFEKKSN